MRPFLLHGPFFPTQVSNLDELCKEKYRIQAMLDIEIQKRVRERVQLGKRPLWSDSVVAEI